MNNTYGNQHPKIIINKKNKNNNYKPYNSYNNQSDNNINIPKPNTINNSINDSEMNESQKLIEELLNEVDKYKNENEQLKNKINQLETDNNRLDKTCDLYI